MPALNKSAGGHLVRNADGHLVYINKGSACSYCTGSNCTPLNIDVTISGVSVCTGCYLEGVKYTKHSATILSTVRLTQVASCKWQYQDDNAWTRTRYDDSGCTTQFDTTTSYLRYVLQKTSATNWDFYIYNEFTGPWYYAFDDSSAGTSNDCDTVPTMNNQTSCGVAYGVNLTMPIAAGGTATFSIP